MRQSYQLKLDEFSQIYTVMCPTSAVAKKECITGCCVHGESVRSGVLSHGSHVSFLPRQQATEVDSLFEICPNLQLYTPFTDAFRLQGDICPLYKCSRKAKSKKAMVGRDLLFALLFVSVEFYSTELASKRYNMLGC